MPLHNESSPADPRREFCLALKAARERKGITLHEIAESTKVAACLFAALERNDLRRWPKGLFRRSFFRDYVRMIGLPVTETCDEFVRLFPEDDGARAAAAAGAAAGENQADDLRLALDPAWHEPRAQVLLRLIDAVAVILAAAVLALVAGMDGLATAAIVSLAFVAVKTLRSLADVLKHGPSAAAGAFRHATEAVSRVFGSAADATPEPDVPPMREWISDARRVGPEPRLRVRIKVSH